jgi:1-deoxy-D-xylulose-5-phosphate reductoisomerase
MNAANELSVNAFLKKQISFINIFSIIEDSMNIDHLIPCNNIEDIIEIDKIYREKIKHLIKKYVIN